MEKKDGLKVAIQDLTPFLVGPTAVGKTAVGMELARRLGGEIISADSMQVYRGLDILSAKPGLSQRREISHHLIDILDPRERCDVSLYCRLAKEAIKAVLSRGRVPVVVGGSGMYVRALIDGIFEGPGRNVAVRARLEEESRGLGIASLYERLKGVDPGAAESIHPNDKQRIIRALEVFECAGKPLSTLQREWRKGSVASGGAGIFFSRNLNSRVVLLGLERKREDLHRRIDDRVEQMFADGAVEEVRRLMEKAVEMKATIRQSLGLKEIRGCLEGRCTIEEAKSALKKNTRALAKRQFTWFRGDPRITWLELARAEDAAVTAERLKDLISHPRGGI